jgi:BirA family transcriptional regulator, biotin operon repressor / biotin---[acetyl-CoA-carboxylase] ligase
MLVAATPKSGSCLPPSAASPRTTWQAAVMSEHDEPSRRPLSATAIQAVIDSSALFTAVEVVARTGSTNADLLAAVRNGAPTGSVLIAEEQSAGRGRLDRSWHSRPGAGLTFSVLLRPAEVPAARRGWLPLLTGVAVTAALRAETAVEAGLKWPNDVLADSADGPRKLAGILAEQAGDAIVVGVGLNVSATRRELPSDQATSLLLAGGANLDRQAILTAVLRELERWYLRWTGGPRPGDAAASGLRAAYLAVCWTLGRDVRVELPGGGVLTGRAGDVDDAGSLVISGPDGVHPVSAGDVVHVR